MNTIIKLTLALFLSTTYLTAQAANNFVSGGYSSIGAGSTSGDATTASVIKAEYERKLSDLITLNGGIGLLTYTSNSSGSTWTYSEEGRGHALFADLIFYPGKNTFSSFYVGPGVGLTPMSIEWTEVNGKVTTTGKMTATVFDIHAKAGWKFNAGPVVIDPNIRLGYFLNAPKGGNVNDEASLGIYLLLGVNVGVPF